MSNTIEMEIPSRITSAAKRMTHLLETGYLPPSLTSDINTLMQAAMCWDLYESDAAPQTVA